VDVSLNVLGVGDVLGKPKVWGELILAPNDFDAPSFVYLNGTTVVANVTAAPNGATTADKIVYNAANTRHGVFQPIPIIAGATYELIVDAKPAGYSWLHINGQINGAGGGLAPYYYNFDLANGVIGLSDAPVETRTIVPLGNGWYRRKGQAIATATLSINVYLAGMPVERAEMNPTQIGNNVDGIYLANYSIRRIA
jgi:hypothetical protein